MFGGLQKILNYQFTPNNLKNDIIQKIECNITNYNINDLLQL